MITVVKYSIDYRRDWDTFVDDAKNGVFFFKRDYMEYHSDRFEDHSLLFFKSGKLIALLPANQLEATLYSHQGLTFGGLIMRRKIKQVDVLQIFDAIEQYAHEQGIVSVVYKKLPHIYDAYPAEEDVYALFRKKAHCYRVDVTTTIDLQAPISFGTGKKSGVKKARKEGVQVSRIADTTQPFFEMVQSRLRDKYDSIPTHSYQEMDYLMSKFPDNIHLYHATREGQLLAGVIVYRFGHLVHSQYISSTEEGRYYRAVDYLIHHVVYEAYQNIRWFDFGISNEEQGKYLNDNLIGQKEEFGGRAIVHSHYQWPLVQSKGEA